MTLPIHPTFANAVLEQAGGIRLRIHSPSIALPTDFAAKFRRGILRNTPLRIAVELPIEFTHFVNLSHENRLKVTLPVPSETQSGL